MIARKGKINKIWEYMSDEDIQDMYNTGKYDDSYLDDCYSRVNKEEIEKLYFRKKFTKTIPLYDIYVDEYRNVDDQIFALELLAKLNKIEKSIIIKYYIEGYTLKELSEMLNLPVSSIHDIKRKTIKKLKKVK